MIGQLGALRHLAEVTDGEIGEVLDALWGTAGESTRNRNRAAVNSWLTWCRDKTRWPAPTRLLRLPDGSSRTGGPLFLSSRRPVPARRPGPGDICPPPGGPASAPTAPASCCRPRPVGTSTNSATPRRPIHLGDKGVPLQLIMAKPRHKSPRTAMRYVNPGPAVVAVAEVTELLGPPRRTH